VAKPEELTKGERSRYEYIARVLADFGRQRYYKMLEYLAKKIEVSERFAQPGGGTK